MSRDLFVRLCIAHFDNLSELPKYHTIQGRKHSTQCSYGTEHNCKCWCKSKFHGIKLKKEIIV